MFWSALRVRSLFMELLRLLVPWKGNAATRGFCHGHYMFDLWPKRRGTRAYFLQVSCGMVFLGYSANSFTKSNKDQKAYGYLQVSERKNKKPNKEISLVQSNSQHGIFERLETEQPLQQGRCPLTLNHAANQILEYWRILGNNHQTLWPLCVAGNKNKKTQS